MDKKAKESTRKSTEESPQVIIAFDTATINTGYAVLNCDDGKIISAGVLGANGAALLHQRLKETSSLIYKIVQGFSNQGGHIVFERASHNLQNPKVQMLLIALGYYVCTVEPFTSYNIHEVLPIQWKGTLPKRIIIDRVNERFGLHLKAKDHDKAEAIGIGQWFWESLQ